MNLTLFFRLIIMSIFQQQVTYNKKGHYKDTQMSYDNQLFFCPRVFAKDGFNISLQIHNGNYCSTENGYRKLGHTYNEVEFGFPSVDDVLLHQHSEMYGHGGYDDAGNEIPFDASKFTSEGTVGRIPITVLEELFEKKGGIDWEKTISVEQFEHRNFLKLALIKQVIN